MCLNSTLLKTFDLFVLIYNMREYYIFCQVLFQKKSFNFVLYNRF